jgi:hypothetical protein
LHVSQLSDPATGRFYGWLTLLLGNQQGRFTVSHIYSTGVYDFIGSNPSLGSINPDLQVVAPDLNKDGKSDLIVYGASGASPFAVFLGESQGLSLQPPQPGKSPFQMLVASDLNHDGYGDLVAVEKNGVHVLYGGGPNRVAAAKFVPSAEDPVSQYISAGLREDIKRQREQEHDP